MFLKPTERPAFLIKPFPRPIKLTGPYPSQALSNTLVCINLWDTAVAFFHVLFAPETCARVDVVFSREASPPSRPRANQAIYFFSLHLLAPGNRCPQVSSAAFNRTSAQFPEAQVSRPSACWWCLYPLHTSPHMTSGIFLSVFFSADKHLFIL